MRLGGLNTARFLGGHTKILWRKISWLLDGVVDDAKKYYPLALKKNILTSAQDKVIMFWDDYDVSEI